MRLVTKITWQLEAPKVGHFLGYPPELTGGKDFRVLMNTPVFVAIEERPDGVFLFRFAADGQVVGDTWHRTVEEAKDQARLEFQDLYADWTPVPTDVEDIVSFALKKA